MENYLEENKSSGLKYIKEEFKNAPIKTTVAIFGVIIAIYASIQIPNLFPQFPKPYDFEILLNNNVKFLGIERNYEYNFSIKNTGLNKINNLRLVWIYVHNPYEEIVNFGGEESNIADCKREYYQPCTCRFETINRGETKSCIFESGIFKKETMLATGRNFPVTIGFCSQETCKSRDFVIEIR